MPDMMPPGSGAPPGAPPSAPGAPPPQATGIQPATSPVPERGLEAQAQAKLALLVMGLTHLLPGMPVGSDMAKDVREALNKLAKHVPPGAVSPGIQMTEAQRQLLMARQNSPMIQAAQAAQMHGGGAPPPGPPGGGAPPPMA